MPTPRPTEPTAAETYAERRADVDALLSMIGTELVLHARRAEHRPGDWSMVGDLRVVRIRLIQAITSINGMSEDQVQDFLADAQAATPTPSGATR